MRIARSAISETTGLRTHCVEAEVLLAVADHDPALVGLPHRDETPLSQIACVLVSEGVGIAIVDPFSASEFVGRIVARPLRPERGRKAERPARSRGWRPSARTH